jgi:uncharacterized protein involved in outer membrane biogenesis
VTPVERIATRGPAPPADRPRRRLAYRRSGWIVLGSIGAVLLVGAVAILLLVMVDLRPVVERYATAALGRPVAIGSLRIGWQSPLSVELAELRIANVASGSDPSMLRIARLSALVDLAPLLRGVVRYERLVLEKPSLLLERDTGGNANWRFKRSGSPSIVSFALIPKNRAEFPTLIDLALQDGEIIYRAAGRQDLRVAFHRLAIRTTGDDQAVSLDVDGGYNDIPIQLSGETGSFAALRDKAVPFPAKIGMVTKSGTLNFDGTMTEPLDLDGVSGALTIDTPRLGELLKIFGADMRADIPLSVAGTLTTKGVHWLIAPATGKLAQDAFAGTLDLAERPAGQPDDIALGLDFARLDLKHLVEDGARPVAAATPKPDIFSLHLDKNPGADIDARIGARQLIYGGTQVANLKAEMRLTAGELLIPALSFAVAGGRLELSGRIQTAAAGNHVVAEAALSTADSDQLAGLAGVLPGQIVGQVEGRVRLEMTGDTMKTALKTSQGQAVLALMQGRIARDLLERASTDLRSLFRKGEGSVEVTCLLGVADLRNGVATIAPLRLRTPETMLVGGGRVNLPTAQLDLTIKAEGGSRSIFALQVPIHIGGSFDQPSLSPALGSSTAWLDAPRDDAAHKLAPALEQLAARNPCRQ